MLKTNDSTDWASTRRRIAPRRHADVGGLRRDGDGEREVEEVGVVRLEAFRRLREREAAVGLGAVVRAGIGQREERRQQQPRAEHA